VAKGINQYTFHLFLLPLIGDSVDGVSSFRAALKQAKEGVQPMGIQGVTDARHPRSEMTFLSAKEPWRPARIR